MKEEIWKPIKDFEDSYEVSNKGRVRSLDRFVTYTNQNIEQTMFKKGVIMNPACNGIGYLQVGLTLHGKTTKKYIHRLVAEAFIYESELDINHIDHDKTNNEVTNLEYVTKKENINKMLDFYGTAYIKKFCGCGKEIEAKTRQCRQCNTVDDLINNLINKPSLGSLLRDVYSKGYVYTANKHNVTDSTIRRWIKNWHKVM